MMGLVLVNICPLSANFHFRCINNYHICSKTSNTLATRYILFLHFKPKVFQQAATSQLQAFRSNLRGLISKHFQGSIPHILLVPLLPRSSVINSFPSLTKTSCLKPCLDKKKFLCILLLCSDHF